MLFFIAKRHLLARKRTQFINLIAGFSFFGVTIGTAALVIVMSVFNGLDNLVKDMFSRYDPELKITVEKGKVFSPFWIVENIKSAPFESNFNEVLEENALVRFANKEQIVIIKGINASWMRNSSLDSFTVFNDWVNKAIQPSFGVIVGVGVGESLNISLNDILNQLDIYVPTRNKIKMLDPSSAFRHAFLPVVGYFNVQPEVNNKTILIPIKDARDLLQYPTQVSSIELWAKNPEETEALKKHLQKKLGPGFKVSNRYEQHADVYDIIKTEKAWTFIILLFIILIAALNMVGSTTMLILEKQRDIALLSALGLEQTKIRNLFLLQGLTITTVGAVLGIILGIGVVVGQQQFGWVKFNSDSSFLVDAYPVALKYVDLVYIAASVLVMGFLCTIFPANKAGKMSESRVKMLH